MQTNEIVPSSQNRNQNSEWKSPRGYCNSNRRRVTIQSKLPRIPQLFGGKEALIHPQPLKDPSETGFPYHPKLLRKTIFNFFLLRNNINTKGHMAWMYSSRTFVNWIHQWKEPQIKNQSLISTPEGAVPFQSLPPEQQPPRGLLST